MSDLSLSSDDDSFIDVLSSRSSLDSTTESSTNSSSTDSSSTDSSSTNSSSTDSSSTNSSSTDSSSTDLSSHHLYKYSERCRRSEPFYKAVVNTTIAARQRIKKINQYSSKMSLKRSKYVNQVYDIIIDLTNDILAEWKTKVIHAATCGYSNVNIFEYSKGDRYQGIPIVFLMIGPRDDPDFFERNGLFSVIDELCAEICLHHFRVHYKYIGNGNNVVNVDWKTGLFDAE